MKYLKIFENNQNWSKNKIEKLYDDHEEFNSLILDYLNLNHNELFNGERYRIYEFWLDEDTLDIFIQNMGYKKRNETMNYIFDKEEYEDLINFMNNPELYKKTKKYNL